MGRLVVLGRGSYVFFFFFFQAEDGIRDGHVTGVQTCALPISILLLDLLSYELRKGLSLFSRQELDKSTSKIANWELRRYGRTARSEERRVGQECRCRRGVCH